MMLCLVPEFQRQPVRECWYECAEFHARRFTSATTTALPVWSALSLITDQPGGVKVRILTQRLSGYVIPGTYPVLNHRDTQAHTAIYRDPVTCSRFLRPTITTSNL